MFSMGEEKPLFVGCGLAAVLGVTFRNTTIDVVLRRDRSAGPHMQGSQLPMLNPHAFAVLSRLNICWDIGRIRDILATTDTLH